VGIIMSNNDLGVAYELKNCINHNPKVLRCVCALLHMPRISDYCGLRGFFEAFVDNK